MHRQLFHFALQKSELREQRGSDSVSGGKRRANGAFRQPNLLGSAGLFHRKTEAGPRKGLDLRLQFKDLLFGTEIRRRESPSGHRTDVRGKYFFGLHVYTGG